MLRRNQRLRKEYLYRKSLEGKERAAYERKRIVRKALEGVCHAGSLHRHEADNMQAAALCMLTQSHCTNHAFHHARLNCIHYLSFYAEGKPIPNEVRGEEKKLRHEVELEDDNTAVSLLSPLWVKQMI